MSTPFILHLTRLLGAPPPPVLAWWQQAQRRTVPRGQPLLRAQDRWQSLWWVERGALRLFYLDRHGAEANKNFFLNHALLWPITPSLREKPVMFHVEPMEDSVVWSLPMPAHHAPFEPPWPAWTALEWQVLCALLDGKMQREQEFLQYSARERYARLLQLQPDWAQRIPLKHLASYLGVTDVSLSRLRSEMGLIKG